MLKALEEGRHNYFYKSIRYMLMLNDRPKFPGVTPLTKPLAPRRGADSSGTHERTTLARPYK